MIAWLTGRLVEKAPTRVILDVHGVGYDVAVPVSTFYAIGDPGGDVTLRVHTHVREDALALFGFRTTFELAVFERLIGISGIGPKLALAVLSGIEAADLVQAVQRGDVARLTRIPGVGKKTAERICLELKDRLPVVEPDGQAPPPPPPGRCAARRPRVGPRESRLPSLSRGQGARSAALGRRSAAVRRGAARRA